MATKLYGKDLKDYDDIDIDSLLSKLTTEELEELNNEVDPDNSLIPPHLRCKDQTTKQPTGNYDRDKLISYLVEQAKNEKDWEESVPYVSGTKRGKEFIGKPVAAPETEEMPIELDVDDEFEAALNDASEGDLVDLAGILGMHSMLSQTQFYNAIKGKPQEDDGSTFKGIVKSSLPLIQPSEPPNDTDVEDCIKRLEAQDGSLTDVNINNMKETSRERIRRLLDAAKGSTHLLKLSLANVAVRDPDLEALIDVLEQNTSLVSVNLESNFLTGEMLVNLLRATLKNQTLVEFRAANQRNATLGNQVEMELTRIIEHNDTLLRVGISFDSMAARSRVAEALERNYEQLRLKRLQS